MKIKYFLLVFFLCIFFVGKLDVHGIEECQVSLLTIMPSHKKIYTVYGHSALRIYIPRQHINTVYSWGTFNFDNPHFLYRFLKGDTDCFLSSVDYSSFIQSYHSSYSTVVEQVLSISMENKKSLLQKIAYNLRPENRMYHYDILKDNCTTRIRDLLENIFSNSLYTSIQMKSKTFRQWIHAYTEPNHWMTFGIDLLMGNEADHLINQRESLFLPMNLKEKLTHFKYKGGIPLIVSSQNIIQLEQNKVDCSLFISPLQLGWILICFYGVLFIAIGMNYFLKRNSLNILKIIGNSCAFLFFIYASVGSLILFVVLFSSHPYTSFNWNLLWLHPFHFIAFIGFFLKRPFYWIIGYHGGNVILLALLLIGKLCFIQSLNPEIIPYVICLITASFFYLLKGKFLKLHEDNR